MKAIYIFIVSVVMAHMLITSESDAGRIKKCSKECTESQTEELNELKSDNQAQTEELNELKSDNQGALSASSILGGLDSKYRDQLNLYLAPVLQNSSHSRFVKCWHAKTDGWALSTFHSNCDEKGPTVTIIQVGNYIFGGYTDVSWFSSCELASSSKSFLFSLNNINGYDPVELRIKSEETSDAIAGCTLLGPTFGARDISISDNAGSNQHSIAGCGYTYPFPPGYSSSGSNCTFYAGSTNFTPTDIEVLYETID